MNNETVKKIVMTIFLEISHIILRNLNTHTKEKKDRQQELWSKYIIACQQGGVSKKNRLGSGQRRGTGR